MALSVGLDIARSSLAANGEQIAIVSRNIARAQDPDAIRKVGRVVTGPGQAVHIARIDRASDALLLDKFLLSNSASRSQSEIYSALGKLEGTAGDLQLGRSPATQIAELSSALQRYSATPDNAAAAMSVVNVARDLASSLNEGSAAIDGVRQQADAGITDSVARINDLLGQFKALNDEIVQGSRGGKDVTDTMDARDGILKDLSAEIGISTLSRADGDVAIFTESGVTLFDRVPRSVTFAASPMLASGATGAAVYADGVPITGGQSVLGIENGRIAGLVAVRDDIAPAYQRQFDEIARGLISAFAEYDQSATPTLPPAAGLFSYPGGPAVPASASVIAGLAGTISVNPRVDPAAGGNPMLIRDGGISSANTAYVYNSSGFASFTDRIDELIGKLDEAQVFDPAARLPASASLAAYARNSTAWLESLRQSAKSETDYRNAVSERARASLSKETGVSLDEEMTNMLELERTFQASSRLITTIDNMLETLVASIR